MFNGKYYVVDGNQEGESFLALAGYIKSKLDYTATTTFSFDSSFDFNFETEHDVPKNGFLLVSLPSVMEFPEEVVAS